MNSKIIFDFIRPKLGVKQSQVDALFRILEKSSIEDVALFLGMGQEEKDKMEQSVVAKDGNFQLSERSLKRLDGVNPKLVSVVKKAIQISDYDFIVVEGLRSIETQRKYVSEGKSKTMKSYHLTGDAVDLAPIENGKIDWTNSKGQFDSVAESMKQAAKEFGVKITWGGDWKSFVDKPHFQIEK